MLRCVWKSGNADRIGAVAVLQGWVLSCPPSPMHRIVPGEEETRWRHKETHTLHTRWFTGVAQDLVAAQNLMKTYSDIFTVLLWILPILECVDFAALSNEK